MRCNIIEIVGKTRKDLTIEIIEEINRETKCEAIKFNGNNILNEFQSYIQDHKDKLDPVTRLSTYHTHWQPDYLVAFKNLQLLAISSRLSLKFPDMRELTNLKAVHIDNISKPTDLENIWTISN